MQGKKYFLNARGGAFSEKPSPGQCVYSFTELRGHLVNVTFHNTKFGETIRLHIVNETDFYLVSMFVASRQANVFFVLAKSLDLHNEMTFQMSLREGKSHFKIFQSGSLVKWFYARENMNELPSDDEARKIFFKDMISTEIVSILKKKENPYRKHQFYTPAGSGLQGGYFSDAKTDYNVHVAIQKEYEAKGLVYPKTEKEKFYAKRL